MFRPVPGVPLLLIAVLGLPLFASAQAAPGFLEVSAAPGVVVKPFGNSRTGFGFGVGVGKNMLNAEVSRDSLSGYGLGTGNTLNPIVRLSGFVFIDPTTGQQPGPALANPLPQGAISNSYVERAGASFQRDLYSVSSRATIYAVGGGAYVRPHFNENFQLNCSTCGASYVPAPVSIVARANTLEVSYGGGIRIPLAKGFGVRAEVRASTSKGVSELTNDKYVPFISGGATGNDTLIVPGRDTLVAVSFAVYYRWVSRHL